MYDCPTSKKCVGRPIPVSLTPDLRFLRIGNSTLTQSDDSLYHPVEIFDDQDDYFEDIAFCDGFVAVSSRRHLTKEDLIKTSEPGSIGHEEGLARFLKLVIDAESKASSSTNPTTKQGSNVEGSTVSAYSSTTSLDSMSVEHTEDAQVSKLEDHDQAPTAEVEETLEPWELESNTESTANSAETSWSDGSTDVSSNNLEDDDQWNDWGNERAAFEDLKEQIGDEYDDPHDDSSDEDNSMTDHDDSSNEDNGMTDDIEVEDCASDYSDDPELFVPGTGISVSLTRSGVNEDDSESENSVLSHYSQSLYSTSGDEEDSDYEHEGTKLDNLLFGRLKADKTDRAHRISVRIFDTVNQQQKPIFHFSQYVERGLFSSPPVFHPSKPLMVWPLGAGEVLFANYQNNTYFTRLLCPSGFGSCQVFIKSHFSGNGCFLHFAVLEASYAEEESKTPASETSRQQVLLTLQVSTHRLSAGKTARSPPHLICRTNVMLGRTHSVSVSTLPYTLTWTDQYLYFVKRDTKLNVIRIPLFRPTEAGEKTTVCYPRNDIYLPRTAELRDVYYYPPQEHTKRGKEGIGTIIIGSHSSIPAQRKLVPRNAVKPPISVFVSEEKDLGGWVCKADAVNVEQRQNNAAGRLQSKFERFDLKEDCDIVPYLA